MIEFRLDSRSGVPTYLQLVQQVKQAVQLGFLRPGDQLPTVKEVVAKLVINPNTVLKAYRELDLEGIVEGRRGQGTFVAATLPKPPLENHQSLHKALLKWVTSARRAGLDEEAITALFATTVRASFFEKAASAPPPRSRAVASGSASARAGACGIARSPFHWAA